MAGKIWSWIQRSKSQEPIISRSDVQSSSDSPTQQIDVKSALDAVIEARLSRNAHSSLLYANAAGYGSSSGTIDHQNLAHFFKYISKPESDFLQADIDTTKSAFVSELDFAIKSEIWERFLFKLRKAPTSGEEYELISSLRSLLGAGSLEELAAKHGYDIGAAAINRAIKLKHYELNKILTELEERKSVLRPLLTRAKAMGKNKYGEQDDTLFLKEVYELLEHFFPQESMSFYYVMKPMDEIQRHIAGWLDGFGIDEPMPDEGIDFEYWCARQLEKQGWRANVSKASGDQGVDIEAWRGEFCVAVQCKRYNQPIGNKAVQEVFAGKQHRNANAAAIIGTGGFTKSAIELATATNVKLFDAEEIGFFSERFG